jgi:hypothetical protein
MLIMTYNGEPDFKNRSFVFVEIEHMSLIHLTKEEIGAFKTIRIIPVLGIIDLLNKNVY